MPCSTYFFKSLGCFFGGSKGEVTYFFEKLEKLYNEYGYLSERVIYLQEPLRFAVDYAKFVLDCNYHLYILHEKVQILHSDISPNNIMILPTRRHSNSQPLFSENERGIYEVHVNISRDTEWTIDLLDETPLEEVRITAETLINYQFFEQKDGSESHYA